MKVIVLYGGVSPEREVSLSSGAAVAAALNDFGCEAELYDIRSISEFVKKWDTLAADGVFIALHGGWGENGKLQAVLEAFGIPYTGSGPEACMFSMDKSAAKLAFSAVGIPAPRGYIATREDRGRGAAAEYIEKYGRIIVKPNGGGSTVGVTCLSTLAGYDAALELAWQSEKKALVEEFIEGEEVTVPVWEQKAGETVALPAIHIKPKSGFYDYKNKYTQGRTEYICPSDLTPEINAKLAEYARAAHIALGCRAYSRIDFRVTPNGEIFALEANTAPGMTATSLVPKSAKAYGLSFGEFLNEIISLSFSIKRE
ncbi:MAG: D-alanine--D-alanine ligase [Synergistaceae bacterium]|nr:D-alanine--D-alanine ligase [Synergistaceae bacterium]